MRFVAWELGLNDPQIAKLLGRTRTAIIEWRRRERLQANCPRVRYSDVEDAPDFPEPLWSAYCKSQNNRMAYESAVIRRFMSERGWPLKKSLKGPTARTPDGLVHVTWHPVYRRTHSRREDSVLLCRRDHPIPKVQCTLLRDGVPTCPDCLKLLITKRIRISNRYR